MVYYIIIAITLVLFVLLHVWVFPSMFLKARSLPAGDRAVKDIIEENGRSIIYEPDRKYCRYIKHYVLAERNGKKQLKCEVDKSLRYIEYDVRMFDANNKLFKTYTIKQVLSGSGVTPKIVELDKRTAYINVAVRRVDDKKLPADNVRKVSRGGIFMYFLCTIITEIVCTFAVKISIAQLYGGIYHETFLMSFDSTVITLAVCAVMIILNIIITCVSLRKYTRGKAAKRGSHA